MRIGHIKLLVALVIMLMLPITTVKADSEGISQSDFEERLSELQNDYPDYSTWTGTYAGGRQCWGFARLVADYVFDGNCNTEWSRIYSIADVKAGDILQYGNTSGSGHTVFVTNVSGSIITFLDCNGNGNYSNGTKVRTCGIKWNNTISKSSKMFGKYSFSYLLESPGICDLSYTNCITLWASGFKYGEGNNGSKDCFDLGESTFQKNEGDSFKLAANMNKSTIPNGYKLDCSKWGSSGFTSDGSWKWYSFSDTVEQLDRKAWIQYSCDPIEYKITYNLNGGTNNSSNPTSYNVLYGVSLKDPVKDGYVFDGWTDSHGNRITGINAGANASFSSADDMINKLKSRTTGNQTLTANWKANNIELWATGFQNSEGNNNAKDCFYLGKSTFTRKIGDDYRFTPDLNKVAIPNGYTLDTSKWGSTGFTSDGSWKWYTFNDAVSQPAKETWSQYFCNPVQYTITYNLNGGTNNENNPESYNVLYGVTLKDPVREGCIFDGWTDGNGKKVTGINPGANASFSSATDMISKLGSRTTGNQVLTANWKSDSITSFTNHIDLWANGFENGEGNNDDKNCFYLGESKFIKTKGNQYTFLNEFNTVAIPNGYVLNTIRWGSHYFTEDDTWKWYTFNDQVTQPARDTWSEYSCDPIPYKITYNLNGGTNDENNPESYNVLYGVTLKDPVREGYTFYGWIDENGHRITGINAGKDAEFGSVNDLMNQLMSRTTGNRVLTAIWEEELTSPPTILDNPKDIAASIGEKVNMSVSASGVNLTYQWQYSQNSGNTWKNCTSDGYNTNSFSFSMKETLDGRLYRCVVTNENGSVQSEQAAISLLSIIRQPENVMAENGEKVTLSINAVGKNLSYQWQYSQNSGNTWKNCTSTGYNTNSFSFTMKDSLDGRMYRCMVTCASKELYSDTALITKVARVEITSQPQDVEATAGENVSVSIEASGEDLSYQWQWSKDGYAWRNCTSVGYNSNTFRFTMKETLDGRLYRCIVGSGGQKITSGSALIRFVDEFLRITEQPDSYMLAEGETVNLHVGAVGKGLSYQWQWKKEGTTWKNCTSAGCNTDTFSFRMKASFGGRLYRCMIFDEDGNAVLSETAAIELVNRASIGITGYEAETGMKTDMPKEQNEALKESTDESGTAATEAEPTGVIADETENELENAEVVIEKETMEEKETSVESETVEVQTTEGDTEEKNAGTSDSKEEQEIETEESEEESEIIIISQPSVISREEQAVIVAFEADGESLICVWQYCDGTNSEWKDIHQGLERGIFVESDGEQSEELMIRLADAEAKITVRCVITDLYGNMVTTTDLNIY